MSINVNALATKTLNKKDTYYLLSLTELLAVTLFSWESFASSETHHQNKLQKKKRDCLQENLRKDIKI